jgi:mRNA degradation ribonuclease J1/J2
MTVFEYKSKLLIVDCGVLFPEDNQPGIDLILPDFSYIRDRLDDVIGIFLTHGHEDHIGAVPYLLRERGDIAIYGSALQQSTIIDHFSFINNKSPNSTVFAADFEATVLTQNHNFVVESNATIAGAGCSKAARF